MEDREKQELILQHKELGGLDVISRSLWDLMNKEIERNGYSDLTLHLEGAARGIEDIIEINNIKRTK